MKQMITRQKVTIILLGLAACALSWFPLGFLSPARAADEVIKLKAASPPHPVTHRLTKDAYQLWADEIEKRTNGRVKITWFFGESLVKCSQSYEALQSGVVDVCVIAAWNYPHIFPIVEGLSMPFMLEGSAQSADTAWKMFQTMPEMQAEMKDLKFMGAFTTDVINLALKDGKIVKTLDDMKGLRVAVGSGLMAETAKLMGMAPQPVGYADVYMALHRGMAEATFFPNAPLRSYKVTEVTNVHVMGGFKCDPMVFAMRLDTWKKLPPEVQKVFEELTPSMSRLCGHTLTNEGAWVMEELQKRGDQFYTPPPEEAARWKQAVMPMYRAWMDKLNSLSMNGQSINDRISAIAKDTRGAASPEDEWWQQGRIGKRTEK